MKGLSEVVAALLSLVITLLLLGAFFAFNGGYFILPFQQSNKITESVPLLQPILLYYNSTANGPVIIITNYGSTPVQIAYAVVGNGPDPTVVYQVVGEQNFNSGGSYGQAYFISCPYYEIQPGKEYAVIISGVGQQSTYFITLVLTNGYTLQFVLSPGVSPGVNG